MSSKSDALEKFKMKAHESKDQTEDDEGTEKEGHSKDCCGDHSKHHGMKGCCKKGK